MLLRPPPQPDRSNCTRRLARRSDMNRSIRGVALTVGLAGALLALGVQPAAAAGPERQPLPNSPGVVSGFCAFDVNTAFPVNDEFIKTFLDANGDPVRSLVEGHLVATLTNASQPQHSITVNVSGPGQIVYNADGSQTITFLGNSAVFVQQGFLLTSGRVVIRAASPTALGVLITAMGRQSDVCTLLK